MKVTVNENDRLDFNFVLVALNTTMDYIRKPLPLDLTEEKAIEYYTALMAHFRDAKVKEHMLRVKFASEYGVPYDFPYRDGVIEIPE